MDIKDFRIGNIVSIDSSSTCGVDNSILPKVINVKDLADGLKGLKPISLTQEILERCNTRNLNIEIINGKPHLVVAMLKICFEHIKYLHQFQNFTHALTGEELIVNL